ncbi:hypothetical protein HAHE_20780 [Haloferula helveola]|uniref:L,D-TPase catalytic domain-containing protein n=1 Tax=Haloferula helveola TaxID=490095 RepID=A0ABM7REP9_9BACT|nr:hypothetical protein HAHE_20780 [Haloferula helveola]
MKSLLRSLSAAAIGLLIASCANQSSYVIGPDGKPVDKDGNPVNPFEPGTYEHFKADSSYPKTSKIWKNEQLLSLTTATNSRIVISRKLQRGFLMNGDEVAMDYPVSTGKSSHPTPAGSYTILEKMADKSSNAYGKVYDAEGNRIYGKETPGDVPEGGKFVGAPMPYWMRLTWDGVGHHIGNVPRYPASHACIRGPRAVMPTIFRKVKVGTPVTVE